VKVALVHDHLREYGGAERVLEFLHWLYPDAPVYTAFVDLHRLGVNAVRFCDWDIRTTFAQQIPGFSARFHTLRFLLPYFWESLNLSDYDLVISSSSGYLSKSVLTRPDTLHISYCHTPPRYLWGYATVANHILYRRAYEAWVNNGLRQYDFYASQRVDRFVANSQEVAHRITKFYGKPAEVIPPPVHIHGCGVAGQQYYLYVGRLSQAKRVELAVEACTLLNRPLWVVGDGSERTKLGAMAGSQIHFLGHVPDGKMAEIYAGAIALIFPCAHEDFGIVPVEAMGHGVPVIAVDQGGVRESVIDGKTGLFFQEPTVEALSKTIQRFEQMQFSAQDCIARATEFSESIFCNRFRQFVENALEAHYRTNRCRMSTVISN
jgi:glycosyltransferase involved in cell wall biosynthesis